MLLTWLCTLELVAPPAQRQEGLEPVWCEVRRPPSSNLNQGVACLLRWQPQLEPLLLQCCHLHAA